MDKKTLILLPLFILFMLFNIIQGETMEKRMKLELKIKEKIKQIDLSDGVNKEEAIIIAQNYMIEQGEDFYRDFNILKPTVEESPKFSEEWIVGFPTTLRFRLKSGLKWNAMFINRKTGAIKYSGEGPS